MNISCKRFSFHSIKKKGNVLFDTLNTFYLWLYGVRHMVKDHSDSERGNPLPPHRLLFLISNMHHHTDRIAHTIAFVTPGALAGMRNSSVGRPWRMDVTTYRTMSERSTNELHLASFTVLVKIQVITEDVAAAAANWQFVTWCTGDVIFIWVTKLYI